LEVDGQADVCVRAVSATADHPQRFGLRILKNTTLLPVAKNIPVDDHLTHMELEMTRIQGGMRNILKEADFSKEREAIFHEQTLSMHSATMFWPIVQVCVLIMTGTLCCA
jgi:hypothetical protein